MFPSYQSYPFWYRSVPPPSPPSHSLGLWTHSNHVTSRKNMTKLRWLMNCEAWMSTRWFQAGSSHVRVDPLTAPLIHSWFIKSSLWYQCQETIDNVQSVLLIFPSKQVCPFHALMQSQENNIFRPMSRQVNIIFSSWIRIHQLSMPSLHNIHLSIHAQWNDKNYFTTFKMNGGWEKAAFLQAFISLAHAEVFN